MAAEETADPRDVMAIISHIGPDLSHEEAFRLLYPKAADELTLPWASVRMRDDIKNGRY